MLFICWLSRNTHTRDSRENQEARMRTSAVTCELCRACNASRIQSNRPSVFGFRLIWLFHQNPLARSRVAESHRTVVNKSSNFQTFPSFPHQIALSKEDRREVNLSIFVSVSALPIRPSGVWRLCDGKNFTIHSFSRFLMGHTLILLVNVLTRHLSLSAVCCLFFYFLLLTTQPRFFPRKPLCCRETWKHSELNDMRHRRSCVYDGVEFFFVFHFFTVHCFICRFLAHTMLVVCSLSPIWAT